MRKTKATIR